MAEVSHVIALLRLMPQDLTDDKSTLVQVMAWCRQATNHYLNRCWPRSMSSDGINIRPQKVMGELVGVNCGYLGEKRAAIRELLCSRPSLRSPDLCVSLHNQYMIGDPSLSQVSSAHFIGEQSMIRLRSRGLSAKVVATYNWLLQNHLVNTLRPEQNGHHFADDSQNSFSCMNITVYWSKFHWNLFPWVQLKIDLYWFR